MALGCDISDGRLLGDCIEERAGVKTVFLMRHSQLEVTYDGSGEIISIGSGTLYRFEQDDSHGMAIQTITRGSGDTSYMGYQVDMTVYYVEPSYLEVINALKVGSWALFFMDYEDRIRLMGEQTPMRNLQGVTSSGKGAGDTKYTNLSFIGDGQDYAPYVVAFEECPWDNFFNDVVPPYENCSNELLWNDTEKILWNTTDSILIK